MALYTLGVGVSCARLRVWLLELLLLPAQLHRGRGLSGPPGPQGGRAASPPKPHSPGSFFPPPPAGSLLASLCAGENCVPVILMGR